jgi:hypothetical protein
MKKRPPDEDAIAAAEDLAPLLQVAVEAVRASSWRPGDSIEKLLAPAVVAIAKEAGKAVGPHADFVRAEAEAELDAMRDLLGSIWLYVGWRSVTRHLTTEQRELWADAVDAKSMAGQADDGEEPHPVAERWWRDDFVEGIRA